MFRNLMELLVGASSAVVDMGSSSSGFIARIVVPCAMVLGAPVPLGNGSEMLTNDQPVDLFPIVFANCL